MSFFSIYPTGHTPDPCKEGRIGYTNETINIHGATPIPMGWPCGYLEGNPEVDMPAGGIEDEKPVIVGRGCPGPHMEWISVEERLPEDAEDCLFALRGETDVRKGYCDCNIQYWVAYGEECCSVFKQEKVTHWMPLPEPPKEEE